MPITIGEMILPNNKPNLNHNLFNGVKIFDFSVPKIRKIKLNIIDQYLSSPPLVRGYIAIIKKKAKNTSPKLLLEPIFISCLLLILRKIFTYAYSIFLELEVYKFLRLSCIDCQSS